jgi:O-antigen/teichoic acid export membrane protein
VQILISIIILLLAETFGLWFVNEKLTIPFTRLSAANWVYQFSLVSFVMSLMVTPFSACIIAHENMSAFAKISIFDAFAKLGIALLISVTAADRLIMYGALMLLAIIIIDSVYFCYCFNNYEECRYRFVLDKTLLKQMFSFAGWNFIGSTASILRDQGGNIVINMFCGPAINAARGVALQVSSAVGALVGNFTTALNPQIIKTYAANNLEEHRRLICIGSRLSFYLLLLASLPVLFNTEYILGVWLKDVPAHTTLFVQLMIVCSHSEVLSMTLVTSQLATGKIRNYQIIVGLINALNLPFSYFALRNGMIPETVIIIAIIFSQICLLARLIMIRNLIGMSPSYYLRHVYLNVCMVGIGAVLFPYAISYLYDCTFSYFMISTSSCLLSAGVFIFFVGMSRSERCFIIERVRTKTSFIHLHD